jgi:hypothetical protein
MSIVKDNGNWLLFLKNSSRRGFFALGSKVRTILGQREERIWTILRYCPRITSLCLRGVNVLSAVRREYIVCR